MLVSYVVAQFGPNREVHEKDFCEKIYRDGRSHKGSNMVKIWGSDREAGRLKGKGSCSATTRKDPRN